MKLPVTYEGRLGRLSYGLGMLATVLGQHLAVAALLGLHHYKFTVASDFTLFSFMGPLWRPDAALAVHPLFPLRSFLALDLTSGLLLSALAVGLAGAWIQSALTFRRLVDVGWNGFLAVIAVVPVAQIFLIVPLCADLPPAAAASPDEQVKQAQRRAALEGMIAGGALTVITVAVGALLWGSYSYGMFVAGPFLIGATAAYFANRDGDIGLDRTASVAVGAATFGALALLAFALEGVLCIIMAAPLVAAAAALGGLVYWGVMRLWRRSGRPLVSVAFLPVIFLAEQAIPPPSDMVTREEIEVAAPTEAVWRTLITMDGISPNPPLLYRLGVAYPMSAGVHGQGVGAERVGVFSTGVAVERVTEWWPGRRLSFEVLSDPPAMRELSPYEHVHAPHTRGYFRTLTSSFEITPLADGRSRVTLTSTHRLRLEPAPYWRPLARWFIANNSATVLSYVRRTAEGRS